jgi:hypothetical protein
MCCYDSGKQKECDAHAHLGTIRHTFKFDMQMKRTERKTENDISMRRL